MNSERFFEQLYQIPPDKSKQKMYSLNAIALASIIGTPFAGLYLIRQNFKQLGQSKEGTIVFWIGVLGVILFYSFLYSLPSWMLTPMPGMLFPVVCTTVLCIWSEKAMGKELEQHNNYYSNWKGVKTGLICLVVLTIIIIVVIGGGFSLLHCLMWGKWPDFFL